GSLAVGVALTVPTMVNSLVGALAEHWLDGRKEEGSTSAYDAEKALRAKKYQGMKGMLDGSQEDQTAGAEDKLPRATKRRHYLVRHAVPLLAATGTAKVLGWFGIPAMSTIAVIGTTALAKTLTERLVDRRKLDLRIARLDAAMRRQLSDPAALQNQLVALLQDYQAQLDVLRAQLTGTQSALPTPTDGPEIVDSPGTPSFALQLAAQSIENVTAAARRLLSYLAAMQNQNPDPAQPPGNGAAQLQLLTDALLNSVGPAATSLLLGAVGDKIFLNTEERASDAQKLWDEAERDAVRGQALVDVLTDQLQRVDDAIEQLRRSVADRHPDVDLGDRTLDRLSFPTAPAHPEGARPPGQSKFRAYLVQVAFAAIGAAGGALALDQIFDLDDYSVVITVAGSVGGVIGTPVARMLFRRAELRRMDQNAFDLGKRDVDRSVLNKQVAFGKYLVAQLLDQIQQLHEQMDGQAVDVRPGDPGYTDRIRAAAEQAYLDNLEPTHHPDVQTQRVRLLERIDQLAAALDRADASEVEQAQTRLAYAIALYEGITDENDTSKTFPDVREVAPGRGRRATGGPTDQVRAGAARALGRILGEPGDKPRLEERLVALEEIVRAANAVDAHNLAGTPRSRAAVQQQLADRIAAYEEILEETNLPGGFPSPAISP
ncbi:MAG TPA: hypothetical protein VFH76_10515, partial [Kribbella sp.]|nr:hypothetical protein [Kribbella sp.]